MAVNKSVTYKWTEEPEKDFDGNDTGNIIMTIATAMDPDGYNVIVGPNDSDFSKAANVVSVQANRGTP